MIATWQNEATPESAPTLTRGLTHLSAVTGRGLAVKATRVCSVDGCDRAHLARDLCGTHYERLRRTGSVGPATIAPHVPLARPCAVDGCEKGGRRKRDLCEMHYRRLRLHGDPGLVLLKMGTGDEVTNTAAHERVRRARGRAAEHACQHCGGPAEHWAYDHADPDERQSARGPYSPNPDHYISLCVACHKRFDLDFLGSC